MMCVDENGHTFIVANALSGFCRAHFFTCLYNLFGNIECDGSYGQVTCFSLWRKVDIVAKKMLLCLSC